MPAPSDSARSGVAHVQPESAGHNDQDGLGRSDEREGDAVDGARGDTLLRWWAAHAQRRAAREPDRRAGTPSATGASPGHGHPLGHRLVGTLTPLTRLAVVADGTVVVLLEPGRGASLRQPGDLLVPRLLVLARTPAARVLPVSTDPVHLDVTLTGLVSFDGYPVDPVTVRLELQLDDVDGPAGLIALVDEHGPALDPAQLEAGLLDTVQRACATAAQGAVAMNRLANLQRLGLRQVLADRWLPTAFGGGLLRRRGFDVLPVGGAGHEEDEPTVPVLGHHPVVPTAVPAGTP